jgi:hypothetical protein
MSINKALKEPAKALNELGFYAITTKSGNSQLSDHMFSGIIITLTLLFPSDGEWLAPCP